MARADFGFGLFWAVLGAAIAVESWRMDRLEAQGINPFTVPGLVPGLLGAILLLLGVVLASRAARGRVVVGNVMEVPVEGEAVPEGDVAPDAVAEPWRIGLALLLCVGFAGGLVGRGLPFPVVAFVFVFLAILLFEWPERRAAGTIAAGALRAALIAAGASVAVTLVFQELFLVRLP